MCFQDPQDPFTGTVRSETTMLTNSTNSNTSTEENLDNTNMSSDTTAKVLAMPWNPLKKLANNKRQQFRFTDATKSDSSSRRRPA